MDNMLFKKTLLLKIIMFSIIGSSTISVAAGLTLPTAPLVSTKSVQPNLMLLLDSSGSMLHIVEDIDSGYDASVTYYNCSNPVDDEDERVHVIIRQSDGEIYFYHEDGNGNNKSYDYFSFGDSNSNNTGCFDNDTTYDAQLNANSSRTVNGTAYYVPSNYGSAYYTGNYLNWYFSNSNNNGPDTFVIGERHKEGTKSRMTVAKESATVLVDTLENIRVGLAKYDDKVGSLILNNPSDINEDAQKVALTSKLAGISAESNTPLAEALQGIARYFGLGNSDNITFENESMPISDVFKYTVSRDTDVDKPAELITDWCQQSFVLAMTDGLPTADTDIKDDLKDYYYDDSYYSDDVIAAMYDIDIRPDLNESDSISTNNNITTYVVGFAAELAENDLMKNMAAAGGGGALLTATNSGDLLAAFESITDNIFARVAAGSGVSFNSASLSADTKIYGSTYHTANWSGSLKAFDVSTTGDIASTATWDAATKLDAMTYTDRVIYTFNSDSKKGVEFTEANLSGTQQNDLRKGPEGNAGITNLVNYIKGDRSKEGTSETDYRTRDTRLGDIVNSTLVYVGAPKLNWPNYDSTATAKFGSNTKNYSAFKSGSAASRKPMLYVGANDGMLHGFNADANDAQVGEEAVAFIPSTIASIEDKEGLHYLAMSDYAHKFYVDATPTVSDVYINNAWRTVLVGGLRSGGRGLFALDITNPTNFTASAAKAESFVLWEFNNSNDAEFGYSYSKPTIAMMPNGKWAAIVGNGYNSDNGGASLFIIYLDGGANGNWAEGTDYERIDTGVGSALNPNGLSTPRVIDIDGDSIVDRIYAGDLQGNMWAFDVSSASSSSWNVAYNTAGTPKPLFSAKDSSGNAQPITTAPIVALNSNSPATTSPSNDPNLLVFFGTGKYIEASDKTSTDVMSYYGVWDDNSGGKTRTDLTERLLITVNNLKGLSGTAIDWTNTDGWYFDLEDRADRDATATALGERVITNTIINNGVLIFTTLTPSVDNSDICVANSKSTIMTVDLNTGKAPLSRSIFDANGDGIINEDDITASNVDTDADGTKTTYDSVGWAGIDVAEGILSDVAIIKDEATRTFSVVGVGEGGDPIAEVLDPITTGNVGRLSWEELVRP